MKKFTIHQQSQYNFWNKQIKLLQHFSNTTKNYLINLDAFISTLERSAERKIKSGKDKNDKLFFTSLFDADEQMKFCKKYRKTLSKAKKEYSHLLSWNRGEGIKSLR